MAYNPSEIEKKSWNFWNQNDVYLVENDTTKPKYYVLDMFPYPSGAGLHVGHPLGYVASDIYSRYKRLNGFNVLHPMGFDAFGLPAEQYAIQTGKHPEQTTNENVATYRKQLDNIGLSFDWSRKVETSDPQYYKWTQWIFTQLFSHCYCTADDKAQPIEFLVKQFEENGNLTTKAYTDFEEKFSAEEWKSMSAKEQADILMNYRLAYKKVGFVNWCEALGTVLANDEIVNGVSERGGHPVTKKPMLQWSLRITAYAQRLLDGLKDLDWSASLIAQQENWIGRSEGAKVVFNIAPNPDPSPSGEGKIGKWQTANPKSYAILQDFAKEMRKNPTSQEDKMWQSLRGESLGVKFRRQHVIDNFIPDFVCLENKLIVEIDGAIHNIPENIEKDLGRTYELESLGYQIIRFTNEEVDNEIETVLQKIKEVASNFPPKGGGIEGGALEVFTTRPDTIFGVTFMVLAPEHPYVDQITTAAQKDAIKAYLEKAKSKSSIDRQAGKEVSGVDTGAFAIHPFSGKKIPIWISDYVLVDYGTGAIMAVPSDDDRDKAFAKKMGIEIIEICDKSDFPNATLSDKVGKMINSDFLDGLSVKKAIKLAIHKINEKGIGEKTINYKLRDANFSRQRYWGEPFPVYYTEDDIAHTLPESELPLELPPMDDFSPKNGQAPLSKAKDWTFEGKQLDIDTMPGNAGSSWYFLRYMNPDNEEEFCSQEALDYWQDVDLYIGGTEHAVGHLMYSRFWHKFLYDMGKVPTQEPFKKLINQGMIQGMSAFRYKFIWNLGAKVPELITHKDKMISSDFKNVYISTSYVKYINSLGSENHEALLELFNRVQKELKCDKLNENIDKVRESGFTTGVNYSFAKDERQIPIEFLKNEEILDVERFLNSENYKHLNDGVYIKYNNNFFISREVEKMSKSKYNVVNPDDIIAKYGADCFRMFEMFLGPIESAKPWDTKGIEGVSKFLRKFWHLFYDMDGNCLITEETPNEDELKSLHTCIKKVNEDIERFSFNTCVSAFMICVNEMNDLKCNKRAILTELVKLISPFAPFTAEELWHKMGNENSVVKDITYPKHEEKYLVKSTIEYPVMVNGKMRAKIELPAAITQDEAKAVALANTNVLKWTEGRELRKFIFVPGRIINIVA